MAEWIILTEQKLAQSVLSHDGTKPQCGRPEGGIRAAARELGISKSTAHLAVKAESLTPEAKEAANELGLGTVARAKLASVEPEKQVAGLHRLEAAKSLGLVEINCVIVEMDETDRRLWEIAENLHRSELTVLERSEHVAEWKRLTEKKESIVLAQLAPKIPGRPEGGMSAAARELGLERTQLHRSVKIDSITDEAKEVCLSFNTLIKV